MSTVSETHDVSPAASGDAHAGAHDHPSDLKYVKIAIILAVLTAAEVSTYTFDITGHLLVAILIPMMWYATKERLRPTPKSTGWRWPSIWRWLRKREFDVNHGCAFAGGAR